MAEKTANAVKITHTAMVTGLSVVGLIKFRSVSNLCWLLSTYLAMWYKLR
jgi:hypothetical protein